MFRGSCLCEAVIFEIQGSFQFIGHCHCQICRKSHGADHATQGLIAYHEFKILQGEANLVSFASSPHYERFFCRVCGARLFNAPKDRSFYSVALNALDGPPPLHPNFHTYVKSKVPWVQLVDNCPKFEELPRPGDY